MLLGGLLVIAIAVVSAFVVDARRRGVRWAHVLVGALDLLTGFASAALGVSHLVAVIAEAIRRGDLFTWDFRFAALLVIGLAIALPGLACLAVARRVSSGSRNARFLALGASCALVLINAVLVPVQAFFASLLGGLALINTVVLAVPMAMTQAPPARSRVSSGANARTADALR